MRTRLRTCCVLVRSAYAADRGNVAGMDTTRTIARLLILADRHHAPASFTAMLWRLRAQPHAVQLEQLAALQADLQDAHHNAIAEGR
jgi:hypothetical protein